MRYNSLQYSFQVWLTTALAVPHVYILYFFASRGTGAYLPFNGYLILLLESLLLSLPIGFLFMVLLDVICKAKVSLLYKKLWAWAVLQLLLFIMFAIIIHGFGGRATTWSSCFEFVLISSVAVTVSVFLYKLQPENRSIRKLNF